MILICVVIWIDELRVDYCLHSLLYDVWRFLVYLESGVVVEPEMKGDLYFDMLQPLWHFLKLIIVNYQKQ